MRVASAVQYLAEGVPHMRSDDYDGIFLVKAIKDHPISEKQYCRVTIGGKRIKITNANKDEAIRWFAQFAAAEIEKLPKKKYTLVPIPNSTATYRGPANFRTAQIAEGIRIASAYNLTVSPSLRWREVMAKSHQGGGRQSEDLLRKLMLVEPTPVSDVILVDDVFTLGGHMLAAKQKLESEDIKPVLGICCGLTSHHQFDDVYKMPDKEV